MSPPEMMVNGLAYNSLSLKQYTKAERLFYMNVVNYPGSGNVYDSYADLLVVKKDTVKALSNYEKAYAITKSEETKQKMDQLLGKSTFKPSAKDLEKYVGVFDFESVSVTATTSIKDGALWILASGQGEFELIPLSLHQFSIKGIAGFKLSFEMDGEKLLGLTSTQPNGTFKARVKK